MTALEGLLRDLADMRDSNKLLVDSLPFEKQALSVWKRARLWHEEDLNRKIASPQMIEEHFDKLLKEREYDKTCNKTPSISNFQVSFYDSCGDDT